MRVVVSSFKDGALNEDCSVAGTYVHGVLDEPDLLHHVIKWAGVDAAEPFDYVEYKDQQIDRLADAVEQALPLTTILSLLGLDEHNRVGG